MDIVEFAEGICGIELLEWQKQYLRDVYSKAEDPKQYHIMIPRHVSSISKMLAYIDDPYTFDIFFKELIQNGQETDNQRQMSVVRGPLTGRCMFDI